MNNKRAAYYALAVLFVINTLNFFDRQIIGAVGEPIRKEFGLGDSALGALNTAFILIYAVVGLPLGRLADRVSRKHLLGAGVFVWSLFTAASGIAGGFWQIVAMRIGVGVGEAACAPAANSMIADYFPPERRARALSVFMLGLPFGLALSFAVSGFVAQKYGWRWAFVAAGAPGIFAALLALLMREPRRTSEERTGGDDASAVSTYAALLRIPTMRWLIASGVVHNFALYAVSSFVSSYMIRFHGLNVAEAGYRSTIVYGLLSLPGLLLGGALGDWAKARRRDGALIVVTVAVALAIPFFYAAFAVEKGSVATFVALVGAGVAFMYFYYSIVYATIADIAPAASRGQAMALYFMAMYVLGAAAGPQVVGFVSDYFAQQAALAAGVAELTKESLEPFRAAGLRSAMNIVPALGVALAFIMLMAARSVRHGKKSSTAE